MGVGINVGIDQQGAAQEMSGISKPQAQEFANADKLQQLDKLVDKSIVQRVLTDKAQEQGKNIIESLVAKLTGTGLKLSAEDLMGKVKTPSQSKDEYDLMFSSKEDGGGDRVNLQSGGQAIGRAGKSKQHNQNQGGGEDGQQNFYQDAAKLGSTLEAFSAALISFSINGGQSLKKKMEALESQLKNEGMTEEQVLDVKNSIKTQVRTQLAAQIKEGLFKKMMSTPKTLEWALNSRELNNLMTSIAGREELGGKDFGNLNGGLKETGKAMQQEVVLEVRQFVKEELTGKFVAQGLGEKVDAEIKDLVKMGEKFKVNYDRLIPDISAKLFHEGITKAPAQAFANSLLMQQSFEEDNRKKRQQNMGFTQDDEKELFMNQLRVLYMKRAFKGGLDALETSFKIRRLKNGLLKLGVQFGDMEKLEKEGRVMAQIKVMDMLREALYERATLYELSGPAFRLIEAKIKGLVSNLEKLGTKLEAAEFDTLRDDANQRMFEVAENEFLQTRSENKLKLLEKLMTRLKEESNLHYQVPAIQFTMGSMT